MFITWSTQLDFFASDGGRLIFGTISILIRAVATVWVRKIAKEIGKDLIPWTIGAVFLPGLTLIYVAHVANRPSFDGIGKDKSEKNKDNG